MRSYLRKKFKPDYRIDSLAQLETRVLALARFRLLLFDLDNTVQIHGQSSLDGRALVSLNALSALGYQLAIVTNAKETRAASIRCELNKMSDSSEILKSPSFEIYGNCMKPRPERLNSIISELKVNRDEVLMIGDQLFTDVLAGKLAGVKTVWVKPLTSDEPWYIRIKRRLEKLVVTIID